MPSDVCLAAAREHHRRVDDALEQARRHREQRDQLIRQTRRDQPGITYAQIASAVGCSPELVAAIIRSERE